MLLDRHVVLAHLTLVPTKVLGGDLGTNLQIILNNHGYDWHYLA